MRKLTFILLLLLGGHACCYEGGKPANKNKETRIMNNDKDFELPAEIKSFIDSNTVFIYASIAKHKVDYMANNIYKLNLPNNFCRISNSQIPENDNLFDKNHKEYNSKIPEKKVLEFIKYLEEINNPDLKQKYKTADNLVITGGMDTFIYLNTTQGAKWLYFEPESSSLAKEIMSQFDKLFL